MRYCHFVIAGAMLFLVLCWHDAPAHGQTKSESVYNGKLIGLEEGELRMRSMNDQRFPPFKVSGRVTVTLNGRMAQLRDLKENDILRVTVQDEKGTNKRQVIRIEARRPG
jgi:hypothetical protein